MAALRRRNVVAELLDKLLEDELRMRSKRKSARAKIPSRVAVRGLGVSPCATAVAEHPYRASRVFDACAPDPVRRSREGPTSGNVARIALLRWVSAASR